MMCDGLQQRPLQQKRLTEDLTLSGLKRHLAVLEHPDVQQLALIVPFIQRRRGIQPLVALQADEVRVQSPGHYFGHLGLPDPGASFDQQWLAQLNGQIDRRGQRLVRDVALAVQHRLNACNLGMHRSSSHPVETQRDGAPALAAASIINHRHAWRRRQASDRARLLDCGATSSPTWVWPCELHHTEERKTTPAMRWGFLWPGDMFPSKEI